LRRQRESCLFQKNDQKYDQLAITDEKLSRLGHNLIWTTLHQKRARFHAKSFGKTHNLPAGCMALACFDAGNDLTRHATTQQLHFGDKNFTRPIFTMPKLEDVSSNEASFAERVHWMTQSRRSHALTWGFSLLIAGALRPSTMMKSLHSGFARPCRYECYLILFSYR
jgi:hypothetical protein